MQSYHEAGYYQPLNSSRQAWSTKALVVAGVLGVCVGAFVTYEVTSHAAVNNYVATAMPAAAVRAAPMYAVRRGAPPPPEPKKGFFDNTFFVDEPEPVRPPPPKRSVATNAALSDFGKIAGVGTKVVTDLALYLAFNTGYFVQNTYKYLSDEEQKALAKETVDKQLPEVLGLIGATTGEVKSISSAVAGTAEFQELSKSASEAAKKATKPVADAAALEKVKKLVADEKGEVLSAERKEAIAEVLKKGGVKATELSLYLFFNTLQVLKNLDRVLPTEAQISGIDGQVDQLASKSGELVSQIKDLPNKGKDVGATIAKITDSIPTTEDLANLDAEEVSFAVRNSLAKAKSSLDSAYAYVNEQLKEDSSSRATLNEISIKLKPLTDKLGELVEKLPLPRKEDGSIDYSKLLAETGIVTVKGVKALISATKSASSASAAPAAPAAPEKKKE